MHTLQCLPVVMPKTKRLLTLYDLSGFSLRGATFRRFGPCLAYPRRSCWPTRWRSALYGALRVESNSGVVLAAVGVYVAVGGGNDLLDEENAVRTAKGTFVC